MPEDPCAEMAADSPKIVLTPQERSHYFNRRECVATEPLKVGRSVDRRRISPNNLIFDCRVLSRNHAQIWFENGKVGYSRGGETRMKGSLTPARLQDLDWCSQQEAKPLRLLSLSKL